MFKVGNLKAKLEVKDKWLAEMDDPSKYSDSIYTAFYKLEENKSNEEITKLSLESLIKSPEINNKDALKSAICVEKEVDGEGEGHFYLLKK